MASNLSSKLKGLYVEDVKRIFNWQPPEMKKITVSVASRLPTARLTKEQKEIEKEIVQEGLKLQSKFNEALAKGRGVSRYAPTGYFSIIRGDVGELIGEM